MKASLREAPRRFSPLPGLELRDMGEVLLADDEQLTFVTLTGRRNDVVRKDWGFYLSNSLNWNLKRQGFKTALVRSYSSDPPRLYLNLVEVDKLDAYHAYLAQYNARVVCWLDEWPEEDVENSRTAV